MPDRYPCFAALAETEREGLDYGFVLKDRGTSIVVLAPHGGWIEPGSSQIAQEIARDDYSLYCFEGLRGGRPHRDLHITSSRFDEPQALKLVTSAQTAVALHGRADNGDPTTVWMGGRDADLASAISTTLYASGFPVATSGHPLPGLDPSNICNRCTTGAGAQLEIPRTLRNQLLDSRAHLHLFANSVRNGLATYKAPL